MGAVMLNEAWAALGGDAELLDLVTVTGDATGLLPSPLPVMPAMSAAVAASTLAASVLDAVRNGASPAPVLVDAEHVALAARSERYARMEGTAPAAMFAPLSRFWPTADGWIRLHANYPWHRERALTVLRCDGRPEAVAASVLGWSTEALEDALAASGALGFGVRTPQEWQEHPQGMAVAAQPLINSTLGSGPGRSAGAGRGAHGVRVLDFTRVIAGPVATRTLAGWGASVLRLDSPELPEIPAQAVDTLSGKRSALLDISRPSGRCRLEQLLAEADVLVQGYRPGALARHGLDPVELAERHPHLSVVSVSAWGQAGPWAQRRGFDSLVQCPTGIATIEGADGAPGALPAQVLDHATGYLAAAAALLSLAGVQRGEPPRAFRLSLAQTARWLTTAKRAARHSEREVQVEPYLATLSGRARPVRVVKPPGQVGDLEPCWSATTSFASDAAQFEPDGP